MLCTVETQNKETVWLLETSGRSIGAKPLGEERQDTIL